MKTAIDIILTIVLGTLFVAVVSIINTSVPFSDIAVLLVFCYITGGGIISILNGVFKK